MLKLSSLPVVLFVACVAVGCAPKTNRKKIEPPKTEDKSTAGNTKPEARTSPTPEASPAPAASTTPVTPSPEPSAAPSSAPSPAPSAQPSSVPAPAPSAQPSAAPQVVVGPPAPAQVQQPQALPQPQPQAQLTPAQALVQIPQPTRPAPEQESKPSLKPYLWMRLHGDGAEDFQVEMNVVAMPTLKEDRVEEKQPNARFLDYNFKITNIEGESTQGHFQFRHPEHGAIEKFNVTDATKDGATEDLKKATEANKKTPKPFEIQIRIPINEVTEEMLFTAAESFRDFAARDQKYDREWNAILSDNPLPAADAGDIDQLKAEVKRLKGQVQVLNGVTEDKRADSQIRLAINKYQLAEHILKPAFKRWGEIFIDKDCREARDPKNSTPPNCHGKIWVRQKRLADIKEFYRYLDQQGTPEQPASGGNSAVPAKLSTADRLVDEYLKAESQRRDYEFAQAQAKLAQQASGVATPPPPPPAAETTPLDFPLGEVKILSTNGQPSGTEVTQPNRIKLVFVGDAFTAEQAGLFYTEAQKKWDYLFGNDELAKNDKNMKGVEPFRTYRKYFMGIAIATISKEGKSCHPDEGDDCKAGHGRTALESQFGLMGIKRLLGISKIGFKTMGAILKAKVPDYDLASILVNDPAYGGSGGQYAMVSLDAAANEVIAHELMGHSFAKLGDEYTDPYPGFPPVEEPNTMAKATLDSLDEGKKWTSHMAKYAANLATPKPADIDLIGEPVEGAHYTSTGWYRPFRECKMKILGTPFCSVCRDTIIKAIYNKIKPIDQVTTAPATNDAGKIVAKAGDSWQFKITTLQPEQPLGANASTSLLKIQWLVTDAADEKCLQGKPIEGATGDQLTAATAKLAPGSYKVCAKVTDTNIDHTRLKLELGQPSPLEQVRVWDLRIN